MQRTEYPIEVDITEGRWRITASYAPEGNIEVYLDGEHFRTFTLTPARVRTLPDNLDEYVEMLDHKYAVEQAERSMTVEDARRVWDRQYLDNIAPAVVDAAERILTGKGWDW